VSDAEWWVQGTGVTWCVDASMEMGTFHGVWPIKKHCQA